MKVVLLQQYASPSFGILSIMSYLKHRDIDCDVVVWSLEKDPVNTICEIEPNVLGISVMSTEHYWLANAVKLIKEKIPQTIIVVGGIHCVLYPEEVLSVPGVDLVCNSDGEQVMLEICQKLSEHKRDWLSINGLTYKDETATIRSNGRADFFDYSLEIIEDRTPYFSRYPIMSKDTVPRFIASRGCPYKCSFCYNGQIKDIFKDNSGQYLRYKVPENLICEISNVCKRYYVESIFFVDDLFCANKKWLSHFLNMYKREIGYPFMCTTRANLMDEELARMLSNAGCQTVSFGIETGNELIREKVLNKKISDEQMIECGRIVRKYWIQVQTANMFCLPDETLADAFKTIELNHKVGTDLAFTSLFMPFPNTELANYCIERRYLKSDFSFRDLPKSFLSKSMLSIDNKEAIINVQKLSYYFVRYPWFYKKLRWIVRINILRPIFYLLYILSNFLRHKIERRRSYFSAFIYAWQLRKTV